MSKGTIYLVDGTSLCYRSFFAIKLSNSKGFPTGAIYGFFQTLKKITSTYKPEYIGICFDVSRKTFRQEKFKDYKITRPPLPDSLKVQIPLLKKLIALLGMTLVEKEGFEADDIIASLTKKALKDGFKVVIVSSDKDIYQLLDGEAVVIFNPSRDALLGEDDFLKEYGFSPEHIIDYLALTGDSVDNIPGARGIGKVNGAKLVKEFGRVEKVFDNIDKIDGRIKKILLENRENIFLSKELATLETRAVEIGWDALRLKEPQYLKLYKLFSELEFKSLLKEMPRESLNVATDVHSAHSLDFLNKQTNTLIFYSDGSYAYLCDAEDNRVYKTSLDTAKSVLENEEIKKVSHDFKKQMSYLQDISMRGIWFDTKVAAYLIDSSLLDYDIAPLLVRYEEGFLSDIPPEAMPYCIRKLYQILYPKLKEAQLESLFFEVEMPLIYVLKHMERCGINVDSKVLSGLLKDVEKRLGEISAQVFKIAKREFNLNSPQQLSAVLFGELKIPPVKKTKTGYSTDEEVLTKLALTYPIAQLILEYRELNKLTTTYVVPLIEQVKSQGGRLHATFNQTATQTGRLSSSSPNLQSIPVKGRFSAYLRSAFVSSFPDGRILSADYNQIELRILAHYSGEPLLIEAFNNNVDIHRYTASVLFGVNEREITDEQRDSAKRVNFGIIYGMSSYGLAKELNISADEAQAFIQGYFLRYPLVKGYIDSVLKKAEETGFVTTILGRRRYLPEIKSQDLHLKEFAQRQAINTPIQGSCADLIKVAMVRIYEAFRENNLKARIIIQIHDELVFDVPVEELEKVTEIVKRNMEESIPLKVPIRVNIRIGKNWAELQEVK